ncbi:MAG: hypothetical protein AB7G11_02755 [Phycisphaerales bacterium]
MRDLAYLEAWATGGVAAFWCRVETAQASPDPDQRRQAFRDLYAEAEAAQDAFGSDALRKLMGSFAGMTVQLWLSLRQRRQPALDRRRARQADVVALADTLTEPEWQLVDRVIWARDPLDALARLIDAELDIAFTPRPEIPFPGGWSKSVMNLISDTGWTLEQVGRITMSQLGEFAWMGEGEGKEHPYANATLSLTREQRLLRSRFHKGLLNGNGAPHQDQPS